MQALAAQFAKRYAPYEWKRDVYGADLLNAAPFVDRAAAAKNDLEFYDIQIDYVAQLHDAHVALLLPSDFYARLGLSLDIYDDKVLIDGISRSLLPQRDYPFEIGDELVSLDGRSAEEWIRDLSKYAEAANPRTTRRIAAYLIATRSQEAIPGAALLGDKASVVVRRRSGEMETYSMPWVKSGTPMLAAGPVPSPKTQRRASRRGLPGGGGLLPPYLEPLRDLMYAAVAPSKAVISTGSLQPVFSMPPNFRVRLGRPYVDYFYSGTYEAGGKTLGYLRIPDFIPDDDITALQQLDREIAYMQANTDGLIVDVTNNGGGYVFYTTEVARRLIPRPFRTMGFELRATAEMVQKFSLSYDYARLLGAPQYTLDQCAALLEEVRAAYRDNRGRTGPLPLDYLYITPPAPSLEVPPVTDRSGNVTAYSKPVMVLVGELSFSAAESFAAIMQDNQAALIAGARTAGAGGTPAYYDAGAYSETYVAVTRGLMARKNPVVTPDFPTTSYLENVGVRPDVELEYQTRDNLMNRGATFVADFTGAMVAYILSK